MSYSILLLTASWMAGQVASEPAGCASCAAAAQTVKPTASADSETGFLGRLHHLFHPHADKVEYRAPVAARNPAGYRIEPQVVPVNRQYEIQVAGRPAASVVIQTGYTASEPAQAAFATEVRPAGYPLSAPAPQAFAATAVTGVKPAATAMLIKRGFQDKVGCADDYSWITGQLAYIQTLDGGVWVVRYISAGQSDPFGGSVVLAAGVDMKNYREGDLVNIRGGILNEGHATGNPDGTHYRLGGAVYKATAISMIERVD